MRYLFAISHASKDRIFAVEDFDDNYLSVIEEKNVKYCEITKDVYDFIYKTMESRGIETFSSCLAYNGRTWNRKLTEFK